ncbi:hypothetical protein FHG64_16385 [Antarcticibacterium flavum]|uniref:DUF1795 domain-containing protein n=1 Tax=Antarcticibacterium flavum TaxID=2058175 RepID=A0A5B7X862_9FLAO|nr:MULTISPECIES: hypothetical protein [Antarcticibacterium]MCM4159595.1 hypothetical protein [Antarcticibacterium sp. W02-3]QCY70843.1 hypothetical protein FHG64_16385 [Antarcticibacterium flavum]
MKRHLTLLFIAISTIIYAQDSLELEEVNYAGKTIQLKENCKKNSETEVRCNGSSTQWRYLENEMEGMGKIITEQLLSQYQSDPNFIDKTEIKMNSFGSELTGYKFQFLREDKSIYFIALTGKVKETAIIMYFGAMHDIKETSDLNQFQRQILSVE